MNVNLNGTFNVNRLANPNLRKSSAGTIINFLSFGGGFVPKSNSLLYATGKGFRRAMCDGYTNWQPWA